MQMETTLCCSICEQNDVKEIFTFKNYPAYIVPLNPELAPNVVKDDLILYLCASCGHMQCLNLKQELQRLIYEVYYSYYVVDSSEAFVPYYRIPFLKFIEQLKTDGILPNGSLLEIGCSSGEKVELFSSFSKQYTGIDPSSRIEIAKSKFPNYRFIRGYFPQDLPDGELFDVVITQFNLEHIQNVNGFIRQVTHSLMPNGIILIQVPDCGYFLKTSQPNFLAHEHIQYFTKNTLSILLERNGLKPVAWGEEGPSLITAAVKSTQPFLIDQNSVSQSIQDALAQVQLLNSPPELPTSPVIFYGVGPQLYWLLNYYKGDINNISVVDDNPNYFHQGLPGYTILIERISSELIKEKNSIILSLNKLYHKQVIEKIKNLKTPCSIIFINENQWETINL